MASDFSYGYFEKIIKSLKSKFELYTFSKISPNLNTCKQFKAILRHDVDVSLSRALKMAEIENKCGVQSTYMIMPNSPLYNLNSAESKKIIQKLVVLKHEVGLHFDLEEKLRAGNRQSNSIERKVDLSRKRLEEIIRKPVMSISFHRPIKQFLKGPLNICGMVNAYSKQLIACYLSDSKGKWNFSEPLSCLLRPRKAVFQVLIHPIWWGEKHMEPQGRIEDFLISETKDKTQNFRKVFEKALEDTLPGVSFIGLSTRGRKEEH